MKLDQEKVRHAARNGIPLVIRTHTLSSETEADLEEILVCFLGELGQSALRDHFWYMLKELTGNARRANLKRIYFQTKNLDIGSPGDYAQGMKTFRDDLDEGLDRYLWLLKEQGLYLKVTFLIRNQVLYLSVRNNADLVPAETRRVQAQVDRGWDFGCSEDAFEHGLDESEGAGLGLGILVLLLRKMGMKPGSFTLEPLVGETSATVRIPMQRLRLERLLRITDALTATIDDLPPFPDNLRRLLVMLDEPDVAFADLAAELGRDPGMTADLIKYINSASNRGPHRIEDLGDAVRQVGIQGLKDLLYPYGAHRVMEKFLVRQVSLWENATTVSRYALAIARDHRFDLHDKGLAQIAGLLYNLGQIVVTYLNPETSARILAFCREKGMGVQSFDDLTQSVNPGELGVRIARKWNFPDNLVAVMECQNDPSMAPEPVRAVAAAVCLAAGLRWVELGLLQYSQVAPAVFEVFDLDPVAVVGLHDRLTQEP